MNGIRAAALRDIQNIFYFQVRLTCGRWPEPVSFIGFTNVERGPIRVGINSNGRDTQFVARPNHANGDLSPVGN